MERPLNLGSREEGLARAQAEYLLARLREGRPRYSVHLELIRPEPIRNVRVQSEHIAENRKSIATLHELLRQGDVDLVIHRGFDLRDKLADDLEIAAVPQRNSPFDAFISLDGSTLDELEPGSKVGVVQLRSRVQILNYRDDLDLVVLGGDVGDWLASLLDEEIDALVLPNAAVEHLGLQERVCEIFPADLVIPAPCSGILVCVCRRDDELTQRRLQPIHDETTRREYEAERAFMEALGEGWDAPVASLAQCLGRRMLLMGMWADPDGQHLRREGVEGKTDDPTSLGSAVAQLLRADQESALGPDMIAVGAGPGLPPLLESEMVIEIEPEPESDLAGELSPLLRALELSAEDDGLADLDLDDEKDEEDEEDDFV